MMIGATAGPDVPVLLLGMAYLADAEQSWTIEQIWKAVIMSILQQIIIFTHRNTLQQSVQAWPRGNINSVLTTRNTSTDPTIRRSITQLSRISRKYAPIATARHSSSLLRKSQKTQGVSMHDHRDWHTFLHTAFAQVAPADAWMHLPAARAIAPPTWFQPLGPPRLPPWRKPIALLAICPGDSQLIPLGEKKCSFAELRMRIFPFVPLLSPIRRPPSSTIVNHNPLLDLPLITSIGIPGRKVADNSKHSRYSGSLRRKI